MESTRLFGEDRGLSYLNGPERSERDSGVAANLSAFERRTLELFAAGLPRREIAQLLNRAPKTISNSLTASRDKLGARSLAEAAALMAAEAVSVAMKANA